MALIRLLIASCADSDMRYATGLTLADPFIWVRLGAGKVKEFVIVSRLEYDRVRKEARSGVKVILADTIDMTGINLGGRPRNLADLATAFLRSYAASDAEVPPQTWAVHLETLREHGIRVKVVAPFFPERRVKSAHELAAIKHAGLIAKKGMRHAVDMIRASQIDWNDQLVLDGKVLTSEKLREEIEIVFLRNGCSSGESIVSCGDDSALPHSKGAGPLLAGVPIVIDLFPRDTVTGYYFDMTRTVVKGTPRSEIVKLIGAVKRAHGEALAVVAPGKASGVHKAAVDSFTRSGYVTDAKGGFIHSVGHGLGLDLHESPRVGSTSADVLVPGDVITIEPGLYYPGIGGVRIEDTVLVTKTGCVNLTNLPKTFFVK